MNGKTILVTGADRLWSLSEGLTNFQNRPTAPVINP